MSPAEYIQGIVTMEYSVNLEDIFKQTRKYEIVRARFAYWWLLKNARGWSYIQIARHAERDHTTVMHGIKKYAYCGWSERFNLADIKQRLVEIDKMRLGLFTPVDNMGLSASEFLISERLEGEVEKIDTHSIAG